MFILLTPLLTLSLLALPLLTLAHSGSHHDQIPISPSADWPTRHMAEEHHIGNFDPSSFFTLHDFDSDGGWTPNEVRRMYGLEDESAKDVSKEKREEVTREVFKLFDTDRNGIVERAEWMDGVAKGVVLPDFGLGPGHHGDDEYEYEIHHFEKFHDENTREEDLNHPEDIAHFAKHDREEAAAEHLEELEKRQVVEENIPQKFRRH